jgi:photosystem II stability/assembly factor-like uncharacterized protein
MSSNDGATWTSVNNGIDKESSISAITVIGNKLLAASHGSGLFVTADSGAVWTPESVGTVEIRELRTISANVFAGTDMLGAFRSADSGATFTAINSGLGSKWIQCYANQGSNIFAGTGDAGVYRSANAGNTWAVINTGLTGVNVTDILCTGTKVYAATFDAGLFVSTNNGSTWSATGNEISSEKLTGLAICNSILVAGTWDAGIFLSYDNGSSWIRPDTGLDSTWCIRSIEVNDTAVFVGTREHGIYFSEDSCHTWQAFNTGLVDSTVLSLKVKGYYMYAGLSGNGVWKYVLLDVTSVPQTAGLEKTCIYPNPANDRIFLSNLNVSHVEIYDLQGQLILRIDRPENSLNISALRNGIYIVRTRDAQGHILSDSKLIKQ